MSIKKKKIVFKLFFVTKKDTKFRVFYFYFTHQQQFLQFSQALKRLPLNPR